MAARLASIAATASAADASLVSVTTPNEAYFKSRRLLVVASGLLLLASLTGITPDSSDSALTVFSLKLVRPEAIPFVFAVIALYGVWQYWSAWFIQTTEVREFWVNRTDVVVTFLIATASIVVFAYPLLVKWAPNIDEVVALLLAVMSIIGGVAALLKTNSTLFKSYFDLLRLRELGIQESLLRGQWLLVFNPAKKFGGTKRISFEPDGNIGEGRNANEHRWRIREGLLEILNQENQVFSRFRFSRERGRFEHTDDDDTLSIRSQAIERASNDEK